MPGHGRSDFVHASGNRTGRRADAVVAVVAVVAVTVISIASIVIQTTGGDDFQPVLDGVLRRRHAAGVSLDDPRAVLRAGSSVLKTWDFGFDDAIDAAAVGTYVAEAVAKYPTYKANAPAILEASRPAATNPRTGTTP